MKLFSICVLSFTALLDALATPAPAADLWRAAHARPIVYVPSVVYWQAEPLCYWCIRDAIYHDYKLIAHLEANPDIDDAVKGPQIAAARADIHRLRWLLGPVQDVRIEPCCYARPPLHVR